MRANAMRRHDFDPVAFVFGLVFTGLGMLFLVGRFGVFNQARWLWPGLLVVLGLAVLVGARGRGSHGGDEGRWDAAAVDAGPPPDLDSIEPPVGPEVFRLPGWPHAGEKAGEKAVEKTDEKAAVKSGAEAETKVLAADGETRETPREDPPASG
jgi:hypothetical protein